MTYVNPWTDERIASLKKLAADGFSAGMIAREMGNVTRNGVIGKLKRLGVPLLRPATSRSGGRPAGRGRNSNLARKITLRTKLEMTEAPDLPPDTSPDACSMFELTERTCRWPMGDPGTAEFRYCGTDHGGCGPYCARHARIAYQPAAPRRISTWNTR